MTTTRRRSWPAITVLLAMAMFVAACGGDDSGAESSSGTDGSDAQGDSASASGAAPDRLVVALPSEPDTLDDYPGEQRFEGTQFLEAVMVREPDGSLTPHLAATTPTQVDDQATTWDVPLREGITWHDGTPFDAESVAASIEYLASLEGVVEIAGVTGMRALDSVEAVDEMTVRITYETPQAGFVQNMSYLKLQKDVPDKDENPVGTGPYVVAEWDRGRSVTLERFDDYWGDAPAVDTIEIRYIPEASARIAALSAGEVHLVPEISVEDAEAVPNVVVSEESLNFYRIHLNAREGVTADVDVRRALNYAIDKQALIDAFFGGNAEIDRCQSLAPTFTGFNPELEPYEFEPDRAKDLIEKAGAEGASLEIIAPQGRYAKQSEVLQAVVEMWQEVGINASLSEMPFDPWLEAAQNQPGPRPDAYFVGADIRAFDAAALSPYVTSDGDLSPLSSISDPEIDELYAEAASAVDVEERSQAFQEAGAVLCDQAYLGFLFSPQLTHATAEGIDFTADPRGFNWVRIADLQFS